MAPVRTNDPDIAMSPNTLDIGRLLGETFVAQVQPFLRLESTNDYAKQLAAGNPGALPLLVIAEEQTAGRGRGANRWWTGRGSLAFSLLLDTHDWELKREHGPLIALAAGVAVAETVASRLPQRTVGLHWPNDVYAEGRKLSGILVEKPSEHCVVLGIGLNTNNLLQDAPEAVRNSATTMRELTGSWHNPTEILVQLLCSFEILLGQLQNSPEAIAERANDLCLQHGRVLSLEQGTRLVTGTCAGIASDGSLILETTAGLQRIYSGAPR
jgi:BirA family transcriptional regulator, biotin operon repressor / biotin---[acetyl-CoA-carboxylase] ligase